MSFLICRDRETTGTMKLLPLFGVLNYIEKLLLISGFRFLSSGMLQMRKYQRIKEITEKIKKGIDCKNGVC